jgi:L-serine dehydratase
MTEFWMSEVLKVCEAEGISLCEYVIRAECAHNGVSREEVVSKMGKMLDVMAAAAAGGLDKPLYSNSGLTGGAAHQYHQYLLSGKSMLGTVVSSAVEMALSCSEVNAAMGRIVACPTAGSCGIVPAAVLSAGVANHKTREEMINALFVATGVGMVIGEHATLAGADGGCQAECGAAASMAAAAVVSMMGGTDHQAIHGAAIALKNILGLVCDPVAGLVEAPCVKRNVMGAANAMACADMALAGIVGAIPCDEVIDAMAAVGHCLPSSLRETGEGGLAATPTGRKITEAIFGQNH